MAEIIADRVAETTSTTGTGSYSLVGAKTGFRSFVAGIGDGNTCRYVVTNGVDWEVGLGTVTDGSPDTLSRDSIEASSNGGSAVDWTAGSKDVYHVLSATKIGLLGGDLGEPASKTIADGAIAIAESQHVIELTGEGDTADALTAITKTGGGNIKAGVLVTLKGKSELAYTITISNGTYFHLQADFSINNEYDNITLLSLGSGHFMEWGGRNNNG